MPDDPQADSHTDSTVDALHTAVNCYLSTLLAVASSVGAACPEVGGLYRHRLNRLRKRLAFDSSPEALEESLATVEIELNEFAVKASAYVSQHGIELRSALGTLEDIVRSLAQRQDFYGARLRQFAGQMETTAYPTETGHLQEVVALQVVGLLSCVESMSHETQSLVMRMRNELGAVERRLQEFEVTDPLTGMMNRREMERQIESRKDAGTPPVLLHIQLSGDVNAEVMQQVSSGWARNSAIRISCADGPIPISWCCSRGRPRSPRCAWIRLCRGWRGSIASKAARACRSAWKPDSRSRSWSPDPYLRTG